MSIKSIKVENFKSIRSSGLIELGPLNVLIGPNGAGKSNFIALFNFLYRLVNMQLQNHIARKGRADGLMYFGRQSGFLSTELTFNGHDWPAQGIYTFRMEPDQNNSLFFTDEYLDLSSTADRPKIINSGGSVETKIHDVAENPGSEILKSHLQSFRVFHFYDTGDSSRLKGFCNATDYEFLATDGSNLPAFLYRMKETAPKHFRTLEFTIQSVAPFIENLYLQPDALNPSQIELRWKERGYDKLFNAYSLSDGTLRFICLCALLLQPNPPPVIIIDEPESGLHPAAIIRLAAMLQSASVSSQLIVSTQSAGLIDELDAENIIVVDREDRQTVFKRLSAEDLSGWLDSYTLSELWKKNLLGGRPK